MVTIHTPGDGHVAPSPDTDGTSWDAYSDPKIKNTLERALFILKHNVRGMRPCDDCFKTLPGGRTFTEVFDDSTVFISFDSAGPDSGATNAVSGKDVTINFREFRVGRWAVAATIVHELAHVNGAPGGSSPLAESMLNCCGFRAHFRPGVVGAIAGSSEDRFA
jgi:hypothetical protein